MTKYVRVKVSFADVTISLCLLVVGMSPELIFGFPFLQSHNPVVDWRRKCMTFYHKGRRCVVQASDNQPVNAFPEFFSTEPTEVVSSLCPMEPDDD